jgi:hypothetical protein
MASGGTMSAWRREALARIPKLTAGIERSETICSLWNNLRDYFCEAYDNNDAELIRAIYGYLEWTHGQPPGKTAEDDPHTAAAVCFMEHIPEHPLARVDMPNWFTRQEILGSNEVFSYMIGEEGYVELLKLFPEKPRARDRR